MKCKKAICGILLLCLSAFLFNAVFADASITASLTSNKQTAVEGDTITLEFFVDSEEAIGSETLKFDFPQEVIEVVTVTEADGVTYDFDTESLIIPEPKVFSKTQPLLTFEVSLKSAVLGESEQSKTVQFSIGEGSMINGVPIYNENQNISLTITPDVINASVTLYSALAKADGITAKVNGQEINVGTPSGLKLSLAPIRVSTLTDDTYEIVISGEGFITAKFTGSTTGSRNVTVNGFFAGDVNGDGEIIDINDFNRLASLIYDKRTDMVGDLNRDTKVDKADLKCLADSYLKKLRSDK